jgi:predicted RNA-binding Zn-ribbon protein involved in translation (DUF1610 family)
VTQNEKPGCLGQVMGWLGLGGRSPGDGPLPYRANGRLLSDAELSFYHVLRQAAGDWAAICPQVSLADLFSVTARDPGQRTSWRNKIDRKRVDFVLCEPETMRPVLAIELDDASHQRAGRQARDAFVEGVFAAGGLPLYRVPGRRAYQVGELAAALREAAGAERTDFRSRTEDSGSRVEEAPAPPACPKCGKEMVLRTATRPGPYQGNQFWGCPDYPRCRGVRQLQLDRG